MTVNDNAEWTEIVRTASEIVASLSIEEVNSSIMKFDETTKRSILSQKLAFEMVGVLAEEGKEDNK
jgi:hypothetical protein